MKNKEITGIMKAMEASFKQHAIDELSNLEEHMARTEQRFTQMSQTRCKTPKTSNFMKK